MVNKGMLTIVSCLAVLGVRGEDLPMPQWRIGAAESKYVKIEGNILKVEVPKGISNVCAYATAGIDLSDWSQQVLEAEIRCRGENIVRDPRPARGVKLSVHYTDPVSRSRRYPAAPAQEEGSFDWTVLRLSVPFGEVAPTADSKSQLVLGLQQTSGKLEFDLSSFKWRKAPPLFPAKDNDYQVRYPARHGERRSLRGVMGRGGSRNTEQDIEDLHQYGATVMRLQMNGFTSRKPKNGKTRTLEDWNEWLEERLAHAETVLGWLEARDMQMILDLHNPPLKGYGTSGDVFHVQEYADRFISCWEEIARRFKGRKGIYGYDLMNEPAQVSRALPDCDYWNLQRRAAEAIRRIDPEATIVFAANDWNSPQAFAYLAALEMDNVIYEAHMYWPGKFTHQGANGSARPKKGTEWVYPNAKERWNKEALRKYLQPVRDFQLRHHARILLGEFSACIYGPGAGQYLEDCIDIFNEYGWDWTYHSFREAKWWNVETVLDPETDQPVPNKDNDRFRALTNGFVK